MLAAGRKPAQVPLAGRLGRFRKGCSAHLTHGFWYKTHKCALLVSRGRLNYDFSMAIYHLTHRTVGRSTHAAGTAGAHLGYITRASACRAVIADHIPSATPGSKGGIARRWMDEQEASDRKNARVIDKLEIALPCELDQAQRIEAVRAFVRELSGGQSVPFFAAFHDKAGTKDEANPHAHVVIRDRNPATGKGRVVQMSEKGSTRRAREVWEKVCNEALEAAGEKARIDRRSLKAQGIERRPSGHEGPQARQIEAKGRQSEKLIRIRQSREAAQEAQKAAQEALTAQRQQEAQTSAERAERAAQEARDAEETAAATLFAGLDGMGSLKRKHGVSVALLAHDPDWNIEAVLKAAVPNADLGDPRSIAAEISKTEAAFDAFEDQVFGDPELEPRFEELKNSIDLLGKAQKRGWQDMKRQLRKFLPRWAVEAVTSTVEVLGSLILEERRVVLKPASVGDGANGAGKPQLTPTPPAASPKPTSDFQP